MADFSPQTPTQNRLIVHYSQLERSILTLRGIARTLEIMATSPDFDERQSAALIAQGDAIEHVCSVMEVLS